MDVVGRIALRSRLRRRLTPRHFKETFINAALRGRADSLYVEIGVRTGDSFRRVHAKRKVGVDPVRAASLERLVSGESFFEMTSDRFFDGPARDVLSPASVDAALIDGLHEFDQAFRDFHNLEPYMKPNGVIFLDDCNPPTRARAEEGDATGWNGDVWRTAAFLVEARPDLRFATLDCDEGLGVAVGFQRAVPTELRDIAMEKFRTLDYDQLAANRSLINLSPARRSLVHRMIDNAL